MQRNKEGLTWSEWWSATRWRSLDSYQAYNMVCWWRSGIDPTEFANNCLEVSKRLREKYNVTR